VEALRTPMGRAHAERGWFRDTHPNEMLGAVYQALLASTGLGPGDDPHPDGGAILDDG